MDLITAILLTITYADVFDFPLTVDNIYKWLIGYKTTEKQVIKTLREIFSDDIQSTDFVILKGRKQITRLWGQQKIWTQSKINQVRSAQKYFTILPTVELIGITGSLAMGNVTDADDIDLFFIVAPKTLFLTRLLIIVVSELFSKRRRPGDKNVSNKLCLNMFVSSDALKTPPNKQDVYTAHEILQMKAVWSRAGTYQQFLSDNKWVSNYLPNAWDRKNKQAESIEKPEFTWERYFRNPIISVMRLFEPFVRSLQLWYMQNRKTTEVVSDNLLMFHPHDARMWVINKFTSRSKRLNIPLDKVFYKRIK